MRDYITNEEIEEVENLVKRAVTAANKSEASKYITRLDFMSSLFGGYTACVFSDLVCSVKRASGRVANKERLISLCEQDLFKLEGRVQKYLFLEISQ